ncbi:MAG: 5-carboxymethyl-2-hydroxymuconate isomerase [Rhodobacteraceae bacterium]|nr:5-carboxymethyl-2-hydroxymuconate isomerase [Paracoccaceae bacterium]
MKLVSFLLDGSSPRYGAVSGDAVIDLSARLGDRFPTITDFIAAPPRAEVEHWLATGAGDHPLAGLTLLPPVPRPGKIICVGLNYEAHKAEAVRNPTDRPMLFARWPETLIGHAAPLVIPKISDMLDYEAELVAVIGAPTGRYLPADQALAKVFGYTCMNEGSVRDWQRHSSQVTAGKNFEGTGAVGPWLVTADEVGDPQTLDLALRLNGAVMQAANTRDMIWPIAETIAYITDWLSLQPGDMIATGTPAGVGSRRTPPVFLQPGDLVEVEIDRIGTLRNRVVKEPA